MFDSMISQTRGVVTVGFSRSELEGLIAGAGRLWSRYTRCGHGVLLRSLGLPCRV